MRALVGVIGSGQTSAAIEALAYRLGYALGAGGLSILCGGRGGVMEAACRGLVQARSEGLPLAQEVCCLGLLPGTDASVANRYLDYVLPTGLGIARNAVIAQAAQGLIAVEGGSGTLSELALAWQFGKPLCALASSGGWGEALAGRTLDGRWSTPIALASSPEEAAAWAKACVPEASNRA